MKLHTQKYNDVLLIQMEGEIMGGVESEQFRNTLYTSIEDDVVNFVVDMAKATWMNSSGLGMLISGLTTARSSGGDLRLVNLSERIRRPLEITKLETVFLTYNSIEEAVNSFQGK
ncbi:MAG: STAS domain-containing protein [Candidatus Zhuqueibacterota bacterium]